MLVAVKGEGSLGAPTVGTWRPAIHPGAPVAPGALLGHIRKAGRTVAVVAPDGEPAVAHRVASAGRWLGWNEPLVVLGGAVDLLGAASHDAPADEVDDPDVVVVRAETDGTVYLAPDPSSPAFAPPGATVAAHGTLALVEVMKTFTPVRSPVAGTVERVVISDAAAVTAGAALFRVRRAKG